MSDGQFSSKPMRTGKKLPNPAFGAGAFSAEAMPTADSARAFLQSPGVQHAVNALMDHPFPEVGELQCAPFPKHAPPGALEMGQPIASATVVQEYLVGLIILRIAGGIMVMMGAGFLLTAFNGPADKRLDPGIAGLLIMTIFGVGLIILGAHFGYFRGRVINEMCWFCPHGMVWMTERVFESYAWEHIPEVYCRLRSPRPAVGIRFDGDIGWISFSDTHHSRRIVQYLETLASAAWMPATVKLVAEGHTIQFGDWQLHRSSLKISAETFRWAEIADLHTDDRDLVLRAGRDHGDLFVPLDEIPFPSMFVALARAIVVHGREQKR